MTASQMRIAETIDAFYGDAGAKDGVSRSYKQAVEDLDAETIKALDGPYRYDPSLLRRGGLMLPTSLSQYLTLHIVEQPCLNLFQDSVPIFLTSTNVRPCGAP